MCGWGPAGLGTHRPGYSSLINFGGQYLLEGGWGSLGLHLAVAIFVLDSWLNFANFGVKMMMTAGSIVFSCRSFNLFSGAVTQGFRSPPCPPLAGERAARTTLGSAQETLSHLHSLKLTE